MFIITKKKETVNGLCREHINSVHALTYSFWASVEISEQVFNCVSVEVFTAVTMKNVVFWDIKPISYSSGNTLPLRYTAQPVNAM
jgi:hypothetical protein